MPDDKFSNPWKQNPIARVGKKGDPGIKALPQFTEAGPRRYLNANNGLPMTQKELESLRQSRSRQAMLKKAYFKYDNLKPDEAVAMLQGYRARKAAQSAGMRRGLARGVGLVAAGAAAGGLGSILRGMMDRRKP